MKKQINPTIKAYLIRGAFYLLLLLAVCAIPFALAQSRSRGTAKQSVTKSDGASGNISGVGHGQLPLSRLAEATRPQMPPSQLPTT
jgi:hypothetical protein